MAWPLSQDFNEAIQNPSSAFTDADLKGGTVATTPLGVPMPRSGNYADVYQVTGKDGRGWAVKCFTRPVPADLQARYAAIAGHLAQASLPFTVGFEFLANGIRVKGKTYPAVKMQWVEGFALNTFVKDNLNRATNLEAMLSLWVRLCRRLRETGMAHCDLQHGNVLLVPGEKQNALGLKLVDYDGMFVPALAGKPTGEAGHASFQHPQRVQINAYSADLDRFPHLVVATALRGLLVGGKALWDKYDTGDNLLFTAKDFTAAHQSKVMRELWDTGDPFTVGLLSHLVMACAKPLAQSPWLDTLMPEGRPPVLTPSQERQAMQLLGVPVQGAVPAAPPQATAGAAWTPPSPSKSRPAAPAAADLGFENETPSKRHAALKARNNSKVLYGAFAAGVIAFIGIAAGIVALSGGGRNSGSGGTVNTGSSGTTNTNNNNPPPIVPKPVEPGPDDPPPDPKPLENVPPGKIAWNVPAGATAELVGHTVAYSLDGSHLFVSLADTGKIQSFDAGTGKLVATFQDHEPTAQVVMAPLPDGKVLSVGKEEVLMVWDEETGKKVARVAVKPPGGALHALFTDAGGKYALIAAGSKAVVVDLEAGNEKLALDLSAPGGRGRCAAMLAADGSKVLALTGRGQLATHPLDGGEATSVAHGVEYAALIAAWLPEKNLAALRIRSPAGGLGSVLHIVKTDTGEKVKEIGATVGPAAFTPDGKYLVVSTPKGQVNYLEVTDWTPKTTIPVSGSLYDLAVSPDGGRAAFVTSTHNVAALAPPWGATTVVAAPKPTGPAVEFLTAVLTLKGADLDGKSVVAAVADKDTKTLYFSDGERLRAMEIATKTEAFSVAAPGRVRNLWATDAGLVAAVDHPDGTVRVHRMNVRGASDSEVDVTGKAPITSIHVSGNGEYAAIARSTGNVDVFKLPEKKLHYAMHIWGKEPPPADPTVTVHWPVAADRLFLWRKPRLQVYPIEDLNKFTFFPPGGPAAGIEDITADGRLVAFRLAPPNRSTETIFYVKNPGPGWKDKGPRISVKGAGPGTQFRFLGNGSRAAILTTGRVEVFDVDAAKSVGTVNLSPPDTATRIRANTTRTSQVISGGAYVAVLAAAPATAVAVKPPVEPEPMAVPARKPVPGDDALKVAEKNIREIFKDLYARKLPADRRKLAEQLLKTAGETTGDPAAKFALLREVQSLAVELNDTALGAKAIDAADAEFDIDGTALRISLLERISATATKTDVLRGLAEACGEMVEELAEKHEYDKALRIVGVGLAALARANLQNLGRDLDTRQTQLRKLKDAYEPVKAALETLKKNPQDAEANGVVGRFRCFHLGRWTEGLPNLALSNDDGLKKAAELDLSTDTDVSNMKKGDAWWTWAQTQQDMEKAAAGTRAKSWYGKVLSSGTAGLERATAENRLAFSQGGTDYRPGVILELLPPQTKKKFIRLHPAASLLASDHKLYAGISNIIGDRATDYLFGVRMNGYLVAPAPGRYKIIFDGHAITTVKLFSQPDQKTIFDVRDLRPPAAKREYSVVLPAKPVAFYLEARMYTEGEKATPPNTIAFKWLRPGAKAEETIPLEAWFHNKAGEANLTEK